MSNLLLPTKPLQLERYVVSVVKVKYLILSSSVDTRERSWIKTNSENQNRSRVLSKNEQEPSLHDLCAHTLRNVLIDVIYANKR